MSVGTTVVISNTSLVMNFVNYSTDNFCQQFGQNVGPDLEPTCLTL